MKRTSARARNPRSSQGPLAAHAKDRALQMEDIAQLAGVSTSTVSRALNKSALVNVETRQRIQKLAHSLNYSINVGARNLRLQRNRTVAVVVPYDTRARQHVSDPFFVSMLGSLGDALTDRGYDMLLSRIDANRLDLVGEISGSGRAIGVILIGQWHRHDQLNELAARKSPMAVWGAQIPLQLYCTVGSDNLAGGVLATEHLVQGGRRHIAFFGDTELPEVAQRYEGYRNVLRRHSIKLNPDLTRPTAFVHGRARQAIAELVHKKVPFDALFASSDLLALEAIHALRGHKIRVPEDVAVVGYDDIELAQYAHPSLTTVRQLVAKGGDLLVDALLQIVAGKHAKPVVLPTELIVRDSSDRSI